MDYKIVIIIGVAMFISGCDGTSSIVSHLEKVEPTAAVQIDEVASNLYIKGLEDGKRIGEHNANIKYARQLVSRVYGNNPISTTTLCDIMQNLIK